MNEYYPPGTFELPGERDKEKTYIYEIHGEVEIVAYSEEGAKEYFKDNAGELLSDAIRDGKIEVNK